MAGCAGIRVAHLDGAEPLCTEELLGRPCGGEPHERRTTCEVVLGPGGCEHCEAAFAAETVLGAAGAGTPMTVHR